MVEETAAEWALRRVRGPRWGVEVEFGALSLRRLAPRLRELGRREVVAGGASDFLVDQTPMVQSVEAERRREDMAWVARASMLDL